MKEKIKNSLYGLLSILFLSAMISCEGDRGKAGEATIALNVTNALKTAPLKIWVGIITGIQDNSKENPAGTIGGAGTLIMSQSDMPKYYMLTPEVAYNHKPGSFRYEFAWIYYDNPNYGYIYEGTYTIQTNKGKEGSAKLLLIPEDGEDGKDNHYKMVFDINSLESMGLTKTALSQKVKLDKRMKDRMEEIKQYISQKE
ncbi:hypothetical protein JW964_17980 [candidate division KSB1 bacterium]|nr:hypothetical protein [candidate division KSB1 bacterium]